VERYTQFNNRNPETLNHQRNQDYSQFKSSDNEVSLVLSFRASPNAFAPSSPILLSNRHRRVEQSSTFQQKKPGGTQCQLTLIPERTQEILTLQVDFQRGETGTGQLRYRTIQPGLGGHCVQRGKFTELRRRISTQQVSQRDCAIEFFIYGCNTLL
jgi:hypothetical protein